MSVMELRTLGEGEHVCSGAENPWGRRTCLWTVMKALVPTVTMETVVGQAVHGRLLGALFRLVCVVFVVDFIFFLCM